MIGYDYSSYYEGDVLELTLEEGASVTLVILNTNWQTGDVVINVSEKAASDEEEGGEVEGGVTNATMTFVAPGNWKKTDEQTVLVGVSGSYIITATGYETITKTYLQVYDAAADSWTRIDTELPYTLSATAGEVLKFRLYGWSDADTGMEIVVSIALAE